MVMDGAGSEDQQADEHDNALSVLRDQAPREDAAHRAEESARYHDQADGGYRQPQHACAKLPEQHTEAADIEVKYYLSQKRDAERRQQEQRQFQRRLPLPPLPRHECKKGDDAYDERDPGAGIGKPVLYLADSVD